MTTITTVPEGRADASVDFHVVKQRLHAEGWKLIGHGCYAAVLVHPDCPDTVLKLGRDLHDGWLHYANIADKLASPFTPKIHAVELHPNFYFAEIERLEELEIDKWSYTREDPEFLRFLKRLEGHRPEVCGRDIACNNTMQRADGQVVVTDPWC